MRPLLLAALLSGCAHLSEDGSAERLDATLAPDASDLARLSHDLLALDCAATQKLERARDRSVDAEQRRLAYQEARTLLSENARRMRVALARHPDLEYGSDGERMRRALTQCFANEASAIREAESVTGPISDAPAVRAPAPVAEAIARPPPARAPDHRKATRHAAKHRQLPKRALALADQVP